MAQLSKSFTGEEIQQIENKQSMEALDDAIDKYGQSRAPLPKTFSKDDLTESEEFDAFRWQSKNSQLEKQDLRRKRQNSSRQPRSSESGDSLTASGDLQELPPVSNQHQDLPRPSPSLRHPISCVQATESSHTQDRISRRRGRGSRVRSIQRPATPSRDVSSGRIPSRAPTALECQAARGRARSLSLELKQKRKRQDKADSHRITKEIKRQDAIANGGWIEQATQQELAVQITRKPEQQAASKKTGKPEQQVPVKGARKRSGRGGKYSTKRRNQPQSDEAGYLPGEREELQKLWAQNAKPPDEMIDEAGNIIAQEDISEFDVQRIQSLNAYSSHLMPEEDLEEAHRLFEDDEDDDLPEPRAKKRRRGGHDGERGYQRR
ncbi:MAG: hypothetical protein Q9176_004476 [Flavoplaca citrina]